MNFKNIPDVIVKKIIHTSIIGTGFLLIGVPFSIYLQDKILLLLSAVVFICSLISCSELYFIGVKEKYYVLEVTCIKINYKLIGKFYTYVFVNDKGTETTLKLGKNNKFYIGNKY